MKNSSNHPVIIHADMDAFFASVEQIENPLLKDKPVIVGADPEKGRGRGVVCAASYQARRFGIHSAQPISQAYKSCPHAYFCRPDMAKYKKYSNKILSLLKDFSPLIEPISIDEAFIDMTGCRRLFGTRKKIACLIKQKIYKETGLTVSLGIAVNKAIAKIASDFSKPDGLTIVYPGQEKQFLFPLPLKKLWGIGPVTNKKLQANGYANVASLIRGGRDKLVKLFGEHGQHIWNMANGYDPRPVISPDSSQMPKSISKEITFRHDTDDYNLLKNSLISISDNIGCRLRKKNITAKTITMKIRLSCFRTFVRSRTLPFYTSETNTIKENLVRLLKKFNRQKQKIRLIGGQVSGLSLNSKAEQYSLFDNIQKEQRTDFTIDSIKKRFGDNAIDRAAVFKKYQV
ncbi:MAG TPA: DNA polymerase IV [Spirochaetota bacterium]|nr:DNA polymerase IV [Spirochaetota bacterium]